MHNVKHNFTEIPRFAGHAVVQKIILILFPYLNANNSIQVRSTNYLLIQNLTLKQNYSKYVIYFSVFYLNMLFFKKNFIYVKN